MPPPPPPPTSTTTTTAPSQQQHDNNNHGLPAGWEVAVSPNDGRLYYYERLTGRTTWVHPQFLGGANNQHSNISVMTPLPPPQHVTTRSNDNVVHHHTTTVLDNKQQRLLLDTPANAFRRPESHQCRSVVSLLLFPPLGLCAVMHSLLVDHCWKKGRYGDAVNHSRQAKAYAKFSNLVGILLWLWYALFYREGPRIRWNDIVDFFRW
jgi:hypothetical protein